MRSRSVISVEAFGERKTILEWSRDPRCQVTLRELRHRIDRGVSPEAAISDASTVNRRQAKNLIEAFGETKSAAAWAKDPRAHTSALTIAARVQRGWSAEEAIVTPVHGKARPERVRIPRPPKARRPRTPHPEEPLAEIGLDEVNERLRAGAELWYAGLTGDRLTLVDGDSAVRISPSILQSLQEAGLVVELDKVGSVVQYGLKK